MGNPNSYEEIQIGMEIPSLVKETSSRISAKWAAASGDFDPIHYDRTYALNQKLPDIIVNGRLKIALLTQLMTNWIGALGYLKKISATHRDMDIVGEPITCKGVVSKKYIAGDQKIVECEIWVENRKGEVTSPGYAIMAFP